MSFFFLSSLAHKKTYGRSLSVTISQTELERRLAGASTMSSSASSPVVGTRLITDSRCTVLRALMPLVSNATLQHPQHPVSLPHSRARPHSRSVPPTRTFANRPSWETIAKTGATIKKLCKEYLLAVNCCHDCLAMSVLPPFS
jgi:hypothetical protein